MSLEKIIERFDKSGKNKIHFKPEVKIKTTPHSHPLFIDSMQKIGDNHYVTISNQSNENCNKNIKDLSDLELTSLSIRMYSMFP